MGSSWERFRYLIEKFGFDRGRLISQFPKTWFRLVYEAADGLGPVEKKRIEEALNLAKRNKVIRTGRPYDGTKPWLENALVQHATSPFQAIIALENPAAHVAVIPVDLVDERQPLMAVPHDWRVARDAPALAAALRLMLQSSNVVAFVDPYYDPFNPRYQSTLRECLRIVHAANPGTICEIHHVDGERTPSTEAIEREATRQFSAVIPNGMTVTLYRWREKVGGEDFHARYLLTDRGGVRIDAGFSAEGAHQTTDFTLMDFSLSQQRRDDLHREAVVFELVEPVLQIAANGYVEHV
jgi:hypothetical protein